MTRLGAQWTMATIMGAALLGLGLQKGSFHGPSWPRGPQSGVRGTEDPIARQEPATAEDEAGGSEAVSEQDAAAVEDMEIDLPTASAAETPRDTRADVASTPAAPPETAVQPPRAEPEPAPPSRERPARPKRDRWVSPEPARLARVYSRQAFTQTMQPTYVGSLRVPPRQPGQSLERQVAAMRAAAGITPDQAANTAQNEFPTGTVTTVTIGNENGYLIYRVQLAGDDGRIHHLIVDAGTGAVVRPRFQLRPSPVRPRTFLGSDEESGRPQ